MKKKLQIFTAMVLLIFVTLYLFPTGMIIRKKYSDEEILLSKTLSSKKMSILSLSLKRKVYNEINGKKVDYKLLNVDFLDAASLLNQKEEKFYYITINLIDDKAQVIVSNFKSGIQYHFYFDKKDHNWKEINSEYGKVKFIPSKPYYIYYEILRRKYPNYMNWDLFPIPKDSLK